MGPKRVLFRLTHIVALLAILALAATACQQAPNTALDRIKQSGKLVVLIDATFAPMEYKDETGKLVGADVDLANEFAKELGVTAEFTNVNWDAIFASLKAGKGDVIISSVSVTEDRKKEMLFSTPYYAAGQAILIKSDNTTIKGPADLKDKVVAVQIDTTGQEAAEGIAGIKEIKKYDGGSEACLAVATGKADATVIDVMVAKIFAKQNPGVKLVGSEPFVREDIAMAIALGNTDLQSAANDFIGKVKADGRLDTILDRYDIK